MNAMTAHPHHDAAVEGIDAGSHDDTGADDGALNVIDDYLDALLDDGALPAEAVPMRAPVMAVAAAMPVVEVMPGVEVEVEVEVAVALETEAGVDTDLVPASMTPPIEPFAESTPTEPEVPVRPVAPVASAVPVAPAPAARPAAHAIDPPSPVYTPAPILPPRTIGSELPMARHLAASPATQRWLRVSVGGASYAVELLCVQEVVRMAPIVAMRGAQRAVLGVMNLRGRIVPVFDLGLWLDTGCVHTDERSRIVVVERNDELIGVLVTAVDDVVWLGADRIEPPLPGTVPGAILGVARVAATPTVLLDANALFG